MPIDTQPLISVIVPVYKVEKYLKRCVSSIQAQTYSKLEIILVDDGSPDTCPVICDEISNTDSRIVVIHKENGGLSDARNTGLNKAKGDYIGFVDSDDYILPNMYEILLTKIQKENSDMACCNYLQVTESDVAFDNQKLPIRDECVEKDVAYDMLVQYGGYYAVAWNKLYRRSLWEKIRFPKGRKYEDMFIAFKIIDECQIISHVSSALYCYVRRTGSITLEKPSVKDLDLGYALIEMRNFAILHSIDSLRKYATSRLSYKIEEWYDICKIDKTFQKEFQYLCRNSKFLLLDKNSWNSYNWKGKMCARIKLFQILSAVHANT